MPSGSVLPDQHIAGRANAPVLRTSWECPHAARSRLARGGSFRTASAPTRRQRALGNSIRSRIAPMPPAAVGHMRRLSRRRPVGQRCALPTAVTSTSYTAAVARSSGASGRHRCARQARKLHCRTGRRLRGAFSHASPASRSMTSTSSVSSTGMSRNAVELEVESGWRLLAPVLW